MVWTIIKQKQGVSDTFVSSNKINSSISKILLECSVISKPTWNFAGNAFISDNDIKVISLQEQRIYLGKPQLIIINPAIIELLNNHYYIIFEPKFWVAEWGYNFKLSKWE